MTFFIPPVFLFGNNANRFHNNEEKKSEYKTAAETEIKVENWRVKRIAELEEENKRLNIKVASLEWEIKWLNSVIDKLHKEIEEQEAEWHWLFDEIDYRKRECKKLKAELSKYKKQYEHSMWFMEEDTLQELRDIWEL